MFQQSPKITYEKLVILNRVLEVMRDKIDKELEHQQTDLDGADEKEENK